MNFRVGLLTLLFPLAVSGTETHLTANTKTDYRIVVPAKPEGTDRYAAETLAEHLGCPFRRKRSRTNSVATSAL